MGLRNDKKSEIFILITLFGLAPKNPWLTMVMVMVPWLNVIQTCLKQVTFNEIETKTHSTLSLVHCTRSINALI